MLDRKEQLKFIILVLSMASIIGYSFGVTIPGSILEESKAAHKPKNKSDNFKV